MWSGNYLTCSRCNSAVSDLYVILEGRRCVYLFTRGWNAQSTKFSVQTQGNGKAHPEASCHFLLSVKDDVVLLVLFQLSQGSPEPIEPNFFTADYHLLHHSAGGNSLSPNEPAGNGLQYGKSNAHREIQLLNWKLPLKITIFNLKEK